MLELASAEGEFDSMNNVSLGEIRNSEHENSPSNEVPGSGDSDSETDQDDLEFLDAELEAAWSHRHYNVWMKMMLH